MIRLALLATRIRGALIAIVVLAMSASVALAGGLGPAPASDPGRAIASERSGQAVPVRAQADESTDGDEDAVESEQEELDENVEEQEPETEEPGDETADNHGALVSEAAQSEPTEAWADYNHGAFVSCVAKLHKSEDWDPATFDLAALTPEDCGYVAATEDGAPTDADATASADKADKAAKGSGHGKALGKTKTHGRR